MNLKILVRGTNDIASAAAHRRKMAFTDAVFEGQAQLEGVLACRIDDLSLLPQALLEGSFIPVSITPVQPTGMPDN